MGMESSVLELTFPGWSKLEPKKNWHTLLHNRVSTWTPTQTEKDYLLQLSEKWPSASGAVSDQVKSFTQLMPIRTNVCTKQILVVHGIGVEDARQTTNRMGWQHVLSNEFDWHDDTGSLTLPFWRHVAVPNSAYVDLHELSARNFVDLCSLKETSMCVRGAAIADVAEMWGVSADVPLWGKWPHGDADRWMWSEIEGCWWALPSMCGLMTAMCSHTTGDSWLPWTGRMFAGFSRYGQKASKDWVPVEIAFSTWRWRFSGRYVRAYPSPRDVLIFRETMKFFIYATWCQNFGDSHACSTAETWLHLRGQTIHHSASQADKRDTGKLDEDDVRGNRMANSCCSSCRPDDGADRDSGISVEAERFRSFFRNCLCPHSIVNVFLLEFSSAFWYSQAAGFWTIRWPGNTTYAQSIGAHVCAGWQLCDFFPIIMQLWSRSTCRHCVPWMTDIWDSSCNVTPHPWTTYGGSCNHSWKRLDCRMWHWRRPMDVWPKPVRCKRVGADEHSLGFPGSWPQWAVVPLKFANVSDRHVSLLNWSEMYFKDESMPYLWVHRQNEISCLWCQRWWHGFLDFWVH